MFSLVLLLSAMVRVMVAAALRRVALVHVNMGDRGSLVRKGLVLMAARVCGVPTVLHLHAAELEPFYAAANPLARWLIRRPFRAATCVIVLGDRYRQWVARTLDIPLEKIRIVSNGVAAVPAQGGRVGEGGVQTLLFLGNLSERKGVSDLIDALALLPADVPSWRAILVGGGDIDGYRARAAERGVADRIDFPGWADRTGVNRLLASVNALILPSYDEGLPLVILEALSVGLPVICTPVGVIPEVLHDRETVLFVEPGDRSALAERIALLLRDRTLQAGLSERGIAAFRRSFSLEAFQMSLFTIYRECCGIDYRPRGRD